MLVALGFLLQRFRCRGKKIPEPPFEARPVHHTNLRSNDLVPSGFLIECDSKLRLLWPQESIVEAACTVTFAKSIEDELLSFKTEESLKQIFILGGGALPLREFSIRLKEETWKKPIDR